MQVDPLADIYPTWNPYAGMLGNPLTVVDPTGMSGENTNEKQSEVILPDGKVVLVNDGKFDRIYLDENNKIIRRDFNVLDRTQHSNDIATRFRAETHTNYRKHVTWAQTFLLGPQGLESQALLPIGKWFKLLLAYEAAEAAEQAMSELALALGVPEGAVAAANLVLWLKNPSKNASDVWKSLKNYKGKTKTNGLSGKDREYYQWDHTHNDIEVYNYKKKHLGSKNPVTGEMYKDAVKGRKMGNF